LLIKIFEIAVDFKLSHIRPYSKRFNPPLAMFGEQIARYINKHYLFLT